MAHDLEKCPTDFCVERCARVRVDRAGHEFLDTPFSGGDQIAHIQYRNRCCLEVVDDFRNRGDGARDVEEVRKDHGHHERAVPAGRSDQGIQLSGVGLPDVGVAKRGIDELAGCRPLSGRATDDAQGRTSEGWTLRPRPQPAHYFGSSSQLDFGWAEVAAI